MLSFCPPVYGQLLWLVGITWLGKNDILGWSFPVWLVQVRMRGVEFLCRQQPRLQLWYKWLRMAWRQRSPYRNVPPPCFAIEIRGYRWIQRKRLPHAGKTEVLRNGLRLGHKLSVINCNTVMSIQHLANCHCKGIKRDCIIYCLSL